MRALHTPLLLGLAAALFAVPATVQDAIECMASITLCPMQPTVAVGEQLLTMITALDTDGAAVDDVEFCVITQGDRVHKDGALVGISGRTANLIVTLVTPADFAGALILMRTTVPVAWPQVARAVVMPTADVTLCQNVHPALHHGPPRRRVQATQSCGHVDIVHTVGGEHLGLKHATICD